MLLISRPGKTEIRKLLASRANFLPLAVPDLAGFQLLAGGDWLMKCFLGRLDEAQIAAAQRPEGLALAGCTPNQLLVLTKAFQRADSGTKAASMFGSAIPPTPFRTEFRAEESCTSAYRVRRVRARIGDPGEPVETRFFSPEEFAQRLHMKAGRERENSYNLLGATPQLRQSVLSILIFQMESRVLRRLTITARLQRSRFG